MSRCVFWISFQLYFLKYSRFLFFWPRTKLKGMRFSRSLPLRFKEEGLALDVPISWIDLPKGNVRFPILRLTDTINYMCKNDFLPKLMGETPETEMEDTLLKFWRRYSLSHADHQVFSSGVALRRAIPVMVHGDEGRGFKRTGIMMLSLQGCIGRGSRPFLSKELDEDLRKDLMGLNMFGSSFNSRMLFAAMAKKHYSNHPESLICKVDQSLLVFHCLKL